MIDTLSSLATRLVIESVYLCLRKGLHLIRSCQDPIKDLLRLPRYTTLEWEFKDARKKPFRVAWEHIYPYQNPPPPQQANKPGMQTGDTSVLDETTVSEDRLRP